MTTATPALKFGLERCLLERPAILEKRRFGLLANMGSVDFRFSYAWDLLAESYPSQLSALFSPQHGLWGEQQANMFESAHSQYSPLTLPVYSLYANSRKPSHEMLAGLDALVIDLQDVGTRVYTFVWTALYCLAECAEKNISVIVLDRPNPLGGAIAEGPLLDPSFQSFVGLASIPMRHGLTMGELLRLLNAEHQIFADLHVIPIEGWRRSLLWSELGRPWILPSPNVPRIEGVHVYPGQVMLEGTNLSEGRGTTTPFEWCGAPYIDPHRLLSEVAKYDLPGVTFRPVRFIPTFDKWKGDSCGGIAQHVTDPENFRSYRTTVAILASVKKLWPDEFQWLSPPYEYETEKMPIDIIDGSSRVRELVDQAADVCLPFASLDPLDEQAWWERVEPYLLYE